MASKYKKWATVQAAVGTYEKDGKTKNRYKNIGKVQLSERGNTGMVIIDAIPLQALATGDFIAFFNVDQEQVDNLGQRNKQRDDTTTDIDLNDIPF